MPLPLNIIGSTSGNLGEVDSNNNVLVNLPVNISNAGFVNVAGQIPGVSGATQNRPLTISSEGRAHVALDRPVFYVNFASSATAANAVPFDVLKQTATTMTYSAGSTAGGFLWLNNGLSVAATVGIAYQTYTTIPTFGGYVTRYEFEAMPINCNTASNKVLELGCGLITDAKTVGLLDGICFRWTAVGTFIGVVSINGVEYQTSNMAVPTDNIMHRFSIVLSQVGVDFYVDQVLQVAMPIPTAAVGPSYQTNLPLLMRIYNMASVPALPPQVKIAECWVSQMGVDWQKPWPHIVAGMGQHAMNVPYGQAMIANGTTTSNRGNGASAGGAAVPATAVGTNTGGTLPFTGLGGIGRMTAQATNIAAAGDMVFCSYQIPAQSATQASKRLYITGISISASNGGAVVATTPTTLVWQLAWGHTAISLATVDAVNTKGPRWLPLGQMWANVGNVIGQPYDKDIIRSFVTPICVNPGEFVAVTVRFLLGTATASQEVVGNIGFEGYWE